MKEVHTLKLAVGQVRKILERDCYAEVNSKAALEKVDRKAVPI